MGRLSPRESPRGHAVLEIMSRPKRSGGCPGRTRGCPNPPQRRPSRNPAPSAHNAPWCRPAHKPHKLSETVTVHYRFHPLAGTQVQTLERRSHRGEAVVVVADSEGRRYHLPIWMTVPEAAQWGLRKRPRLSLPALSELRDLIAAWSTGPALPATGDHDGIREAGEAAEGSGVGAGPRVSLPEAARQEAVAALAALLAAVLGETARSEPDGGGDE